MIKQIWYIMRPYLSTGTEAGQPDRRAFLTQ